MKLIKYLYHVLTIKDNGVNTIAYFHKDWNKKCDKINDNKDNKDQ